MKVLIVAEHDGTALSAASRSCFAFAKQVADVTGGTVVWLVLGDRVEHVAAEAAGLAPVLVVESPQLARPIADSFARAIVAVVQQGRFELLCAGSSTFSKDVLPRAAALLGGAMAGDVIRHEVADSGLQFDCPQFAGAVTVTVRLLRSPQIVTVRGSAYPFLASEQRQPNPIKRFEIDATTLTSRCRHVEFKSKRSTRPDATEARVVVSGGRAVRSSEDFERLVGRLADVLQGAVGSTRALVDSGIATNELLVGQSGKVVAPDLYVALGISGAVQHLAGMRNARTIVAINSDAYAPIFDVANFGLVGDVYQLVPELIEKLQSALAGGRPQM